MNATTSSTPGPSGCTNSTCSAAMTDRRAHEGLRDGCALLRDYRRF